MSESDQLFAGMKTMEETEDQSKFHSEVRMIGLGLWRMVLRRASGISVTVEDAEECAERFCDKT